MEFDILSEIKRVRKKYAHKDLPQKEAIEVLENICDLYGINILFESPLTLNNQT